MEISDPQVMTMFRSTWSPPVYLVSIPSEFFFLENLILTSPFPPSLQYLPRPQVYECAWLVSKCQKRTLKEGKQKSREHKRGATQIGGEGGNKDGTKKNTSDRGRQKYDTGIWEWEMHLLIFVVCILVDIRMIYLFNNLIEICCSTSRSCILDILLAMYLPFRSATSLLIHARH